MKRLNDKAKCNWKFKAKIINTEQEQSRNVGSVTCEWWGREGTCHPAYAM